MIDILTYLNRITSEHKTKPHFMSLVEARLRPFIDLYECLETFDNAFDLDTAVGKQLDIIGEYVGVKRLLNFQPKFTDALLPDPYYRMLLKAQISLNNWDGTIEGIQKIWSEVFPDYTIQIVDNQDMTMEARIIGLQTLFESELIQHGYITPKPMGVLVDYSIIFSIFLDTTLYLGSNIFDRALEKTLPLPPPPVNNSKPPGTVYIEGMNAENRIGRVTSNKPPPADIFVDDETLYVEGIKCTDRIGITINDKPPPSGFTISPGQSYVEGVVADNLIDRETKGKPTAVNIKPPIIDDYTLSIIYADKHGVSSIKGKPTAGSIADKNGTLYTGSLVTANTLRYALPSATI